MNDFTSRQYLKYFGFVLVLGPTLLALYLETQPMNYAHRAFPLWSYAFDFARGMSSTTEDGSDSNDARVLILGDSRVQAALVPEVVGPSVHSLALMSATPIDTYFLLRDYLANHDAPEVVVLSFAPYHLGEIHEQIFWNYSVKYGSHGFHDFLEIVKRSERHGESLRLGAGRPQLIAEWLLYRMKFPPFFLDDLKESGLAGRYSENVEALREVVDQRGHYLFGRAATSSGISREAQLAGFTPSRLVDEYLRDGIALAHDAGSRVILGAMPMNQSSKLEVTTRFETEYRNYIVSLKKTFPALVANGELDVLADSYFGDGSHVNDRGAAKVSRELALFLETRVSRLAEY